ncbi:hypothetical protein [Mycolicibacter acidiphilus]|nr:hypothetical protein [Mycolicibacter acidiphilus]
MLPGLSEVENASWEYLTTCAANWRSLADKWEQAFTEVRNQSMHPGAPSGLVTPPTRHKPSPMAT